MADTRYGRYFVSEPLNKGGLFPVLSAYGGRDLGGIDYSIRIHYQTVPNLLIKEPHRHDFDQYYCFLGGNLSNLKEFGAVIELYMGEEGEKHIIDKTTVLHIPKGLVHGPLEFVTVDKPVILIDTLRAPEYTTVPLEG